MVMKRALIVVDMLNEYLLPAGKIYCDKCREIIPTVSMAIEICRTNEVLVVYVNSALRSTSVLVTKWGNHAMKGTKMAQVVDELSPSPGDVVVEKEGYDGFFQTNLEDVLRSHNIEEVAVCGIHTHVCVLMTAVGAFQRGLRVVALKDCMTTGYQPNHDTRLRFYSSHLGDIKTLQEWFSGFVRK